MSEAQADNPLEAQGAQSISGIQTGLALMPQIFRMVELEVHRAIAALAVSAGEALLPEHAKLHTRLRALVCVVRCCDNVVQFSSLAEHERSKAPRDASGQIIPPHEDNWGNHADR